VADRNEGRFGFLPVGDGKVSFVELTLLSHGPDLPDSDICHDSNPALSWKKW
jgi:hypothetical protein